MTTISKSNFTTNILVLNHLHNLGFKSWVVAPGMGFTDPNQWWAAHKARPRPHEGLDLSAFLDKQRCARPLPAGTIVPPLYRGRLVNIIDDFLGRTVIVDHRTINREGHSLHGFYAHLSAPDKKQIGEFIDETAPLGTIAAGNRSCPPHLHISTVWIKRDFPLEQFSWADFAEEEGFHPCDPLSFF